MLVLCTPISLSMISHTRSGFARTFIVSWDFVRITVGNLYWGVVFALIAWPHQRCLSGMIEPGHMDPRINEDVLVKNKMQSAIESNQSIWKAQMDRYSAGLIFNHPLVSLMDYIW